VKTTYRKLKQIKTLNKGKTTQNLEQEHFAFNLKQMKCSMFLFSEKKSALRHRHIALPRFYPMGQAPKCRDPLRLYESHTGGNATDPCYEANYTRKPITIRRKMALLAAYAKWTGS